MKTSRLVNPKGTRSAFMLDEFLARIRQD